ncbi:MAG TPA: hypothetical protein VJ922_05200 [Actinomycetota bacterium]|nr:hypothetical protein [Actinomycetota bacterium]
MSYRDLPRKQLAALAYEFLLAGHLIDRAGMAYVIKDFGREVMRDVAIDEWMAASPVYTRRMRRALGFEGNDVGTIFKAMQFDVGAPHRFMDFRFVVHDANHGEFTLASCGALMDVEPLGEEYVVTMCHDIEDPTFDATASATNPRARMRPVHRPPRVPADRLPHCKWTVTIEPDAEPLAEPEGATWLATSHAAQLELTTPEENPDPGGATDYAGPMDPDLQLGRFSQPTLVRILDELALQGHLIARSYMHAVQQRSDTETALRLGRHQATGIAGLTAKRLVRHLGTNDLAAVLELHPMFHPRAYVDVRAWGGEETTIALSSCPALDEGDELTWPALLARGDAGPIEAAVRAIDPRATIDRVDPPPGALLAWRTRTDPAIEPFAEANEVGVASFSTGAEFRFEPRGT